MKIIGLSVLAMVLATSAFANDKEAVVNEVLGKKLYYSKGWVKTTKNGRVSGSINGAKLKGNWAFRNGYFCRTVTIDDKQFPTACQEVSRVEGGVKFTDVAGQNGKPRIYTFKKPKN